jgi:hypothetical protein
MTETREPHPECKLCGYTGTRSAVLAHVGTHPETRKQYSCCGRVFFAGSWMDGRCRAAGHEVREVKP